MRKSRSAESISFAEERRRLFAEKLAYKQNNTDTIYRKQLQEIIATRVNEGIDKEAIVAELKTNPNFTKYEQFFEPWVDNVIRKNIAQKQTSHEEER